jgi:hypothetical protein
MPTFEVRIRRGDTNPPSLDIGLFDRHLEQEHFMNVPFDTPRKECYTHADRFAVYINLQNLGWAAQTNRQHLYQDWTRLHWQHRERDYWQVNIDEQIVQSYVDTFAQAQQAESKARTLLFDVNPSLCEKVDKGGPFYLQGTRYIYIIHPTSKKIDVLKPEGPTSLCVYIKDQTVQHNKYDWALAMWKYLTASEEHVLTTANHFEFRLNIDTQEVTIDEEGKVISTRSDETAPNDLLEGTGQVGTETQER